MDKEKITLREIIKFAEEAEGDSDYEQIVAFCQVIKDLKQLEKRVENIIPPSTFKNCVAVVTRKAIARMLQVILQDILGKKGGK